MKAVKKSRDPEAGTCPAVPGSVAVKKGTRDQVGCCDGSEGPGAAPESEACQMWFPEGRPNAG